MSSLYVTEYQTQARDAQGYLMAAGQEPAVDVKKVAIGGTSTQSAAFDATTRFIMVHADVICHIRVGTNPTATDEWTRLAANSTLFFGVQAHGAGSQKIAVIEGV